MPKKQTTLTKHRHRSAATTAQGWLENLMLLAEVVEIWPVFRYKTAIACDCGALFVSDLLGYCVNLFSYMEAPLALKAQNRTKADFVNTKDLDETAHYEPSSGAIVFAIVILYSLYWKFFKILQT